MNPKTVLPVVATLLAGAAAIHYAKKKNLLVSKDETSELPEGHKDLGLETIVSLPEEELEPSLPAVTTETAK